MNIPVITVIAAFGGQLALGGLLTDVGPWYKELRKPSWNPPNWLFGPAWTLILSLVAWSAVRLWTHAPDHTALAAFAAAYIVNGIFYAFWSPLFFRWHRPDWAFIEGLGLWASIIPMLLVAAAYDPKSAWLLAPYFAWVTFAMYLNYTIVRMNPPFGAATAKLSAVDEGRPA